MTVNKVTMYFDPICPFAWVTSRWLVEVEKVRDLSIEWAPMSLSVLNDGRDLDPDYMKGMEAAWAPARVSAAIHKNEPAKLGEWYTAIGTLIHNEEAADKADIHGYDKVIEQSLAEVGLPAELAAVAHEEQGEDSQFGSPKAIDEHLRSSHAHAIELVGDDVGTPVVQFGDSAFFGPVLTRVPTGEKAGELFDASVVLGGYEHFFELKRSRTEAPKAQQD